MIFPLPQNIVFFLNNGFPWRILRKHVFLWSNAIAKKHFWVVKNVLWGKFSHALAMTNNGKNWQIMANNCYQWQTMANNGKHRLTLLTLTGLKRKSEWNYECLTQWQLGDAIASKKIRFCSVFFCPRSFWKYSSIFINPYLLDPIHQ